jgi:pullulanase/glycogen debranching enzyme
VTARQNRIARLAAAFRIELEHSVQGNTADAADVALAMFGLFALDLYPRNEKAAAEFIDYVTRHLAHSLRNGAGVVLA